MASRTYFFVPLLSLTAVLLDRIMHKAHVINCTWDSYRFKDTLKKKKVADPHPGRA